MSEVPKQRSEGTLMPYTFEYRPDDPADETTVVIHLGKEPSGRNFINTLNYFISDDEGRRRLHYLTELIDVANRNGRLTNQVFDLGGFTAETANVSVDTTRSIHFGEDPSVQEVVAVMKDVYGEEHIQHGLAQLAEKLVETGVFGANVVIAMKAMVPHDEQDLAQEMQTLVDQYGSGM